MVSERELNSLAGFWRYCREVKLRCREIPPPASSVFTFPDWSISFTSFAATCNLVRQRYLWQSIFLAAAVFEGNLGRSGFYTHWRIDVKRTGSFALKVTCIYNNVLAVFTGEISLGDKFEVVAVHLHTFVDFYFLVKRSHAQRLGLADSQRHDWLCRFAVGFYCYCSPLCRNAGRSYHRDIAVAYFDNVVHRDIAREHNGNGLLKTRTSDGDNLSFHNFCRQDSIHH